MISAPCAMSRFLRSSLAFLRHHQRDAVAQHGAYHGVRYARVAGGGVQDRLVGRQVAGEYRLDEHPQYGAVLDRSARVQLLALGEHLGATSVAVEIDTDRRRIADRGQRRVPLYELEKLRGWSHSLTSPRMIGLIVAVYPRLRI